MRWCDRGGWPTYCKHLSRGLSAIGVEHAIVVAGGTERPSGEWKAILPFRGTDYLQEADVIFVAIFHVAGLNAIPIIMSEKRPLAILLHDPTEWATLKAIAAINFMHPRYIDFVGPVSMRTFLKDNPAYLGKTKWHYHPYKRISDGVIGGNRAISTSRIDWDKRNHFIVAAQCDVELWSGYVDWRYNWRYFRGKIKDLPEWRGKFGVTNEEIAKVYSGACVAVDMSKIKGDGGRTQYTSLEAMDFGLSLVLASDWTVSGDSELCPREHFFPAQSPQDIATGVNAARELGNVYANAHEMVLARHDASRIAQILCDRWQQIV